MVVVHQSNRSARVHVFGTHGTLTRVFELSRHRDGWWPDGYSECAASAPLAY